jgi:ADP-heptose:LPS heptosyltransferase
LENTSASHLARELLSHCLAGNPWPSGWIEQLIQPEASRALFTDVVEQLADRFEPRLCDVYADMFAEVIARCLPLHASHLTERYRRVRVPRKLDRDPASVQKVFVLSRVTLGADVAVTSVVLAAAKQVFPDAAIYFAGPEKSWELFDTDPRLEHLPIDYGRGGSLQDRLAIWAGLREALSTPDSIVIDPDSRLTQLGLLPVRAEEDYYFFESRAYGAGTSTALSGLTKQWVRETFGAADVEPYIAPVRSAAAPPDVTVSFGVGGNPAKRVGDPFEAELLAYLAEREPTVLIDRGAGGEEAERVERAVERVAASNVRMWDGSFAGFASQIARSRLFVGYDSAGGHVAAACGVPLVSIFGGAVCDRMFERWKPTGRGTIRIVRAADAETTLRRVREALVER